MNHGEHEKAAKTEHTPEPWKVSDDENGECIVFADKNNVRGAKGSEFIDCNTSANARRIVACVNACEGIGTEYLEHFGGTSFNDFKRVKGQRDELLAALEGMVEIGRLTIGWSCTPANADGPLAVAEKLIASVKGGAA